jgi:hypothetical protein
LARIQDCILSTSRTSRHYQDEEERISRPEAGVYVCERVCYSFHSTIPLCPGDVDMDEKKQDCFRNGLNDELVYALEAHNFKNFQGMVNKALVLENHHGAMECKRKQERQHPSNNNAKLWIGSSSACPVFCRVQQQQRPQF